MVNPLRRLDRIQQRWPPLAFPFAVVRKFGDDQAGSLAALVAYWGFFSLFPLLLVLVAILGMVLRGHSALQRTILNSALTDFPVIGSDLLGDDQDLAVLISTVEGEQGLGRTVPATTDELMELARRRRLQLQADAWALGERLYIETPKDMLRRMKRLVRTARAQSSSAPLERAA